MPQIVLLLVLAFGRPLGLAVELVRVLTFESTEEVPVSLLLAVGIVESRLHPLAVGGAGEVGMWQVHPAWWPAKRGDSLDVQTRLAVRVLTHYRRKCGTMPGSLRGYNSGSCSKSGDYAKRVMRIKRVIDSCLAF